ncbi:hypothetical protein J18TS1_10050 [Oceanobacillus oncorhynchi subsp. incaldanensis]|nr:hypothetical protein J18TS1_10050 [Oceanobacillus oncorhynchi subsp. incaldanensis]
MYSLRQYSHALFFRILLWNLPENPFILPELYPNGKDQRMQAVV